MRMTRLLCLLALLQPAFQQTRINVNADDAALAAARNNEINWEARRVRGVKALRVGKPLEKQALKLDADVLRCTLRELLPSTSYEVRVSYAGTLPVSVHVAFSNRSRAGPRHAPRALLDVEKLVFHTNGAGQVPGVSPPPEVSVSARRSGAPALGPSAGGGFVLLDVALSPLQRGLPAEAHQLLPWLLGCLAMALLALAVVPVGGLEVHPAERFWARRAAAAADRKRAKGLR